MKDYKYDIGLTLVVLTFIACVISFYLVLFGLPIYIIGVVLIFLSKKSIKVKLLSTFIPIALWLPATGILIFFYSRTTPETYLIPADLNGKFRVIYGEHCGIEPTEENGRRLLTIPKNGLLIIRPAFEEGSIDHEYYVINKNGSRTKIPMLYEYDADSNNEVGVFLQGTGSIGGAMPDGSGSSESPLAIHFSDFYVSNTKYSLIDWSKNEQQVDSLTNVLVDQCRGKK